MDDVKMDETASTEAHLDDTEMSSGSGSSSHAARGETQDAETSGASASSSGVADAYHERRLDIGKIGGRSASSGDDALAPDDAHVVEADSASASSSDDEGTVVGPQASTSSRRESTSTVSQPRWQAADLGAVAAEAQEDAAAAKQVARMEDKQLRAWLRRLDRESTDIYAADQAQLLYDDLVEEVQLDAKKSSLRTLIGSSDFLTERLYELLEGLKGPDLIDAPRWLLSLPHRPTGRAADGSEVQEPKPEARRLRSDTSSQSFPQVADSRVGVVKTQEEAAAAEQVAQTVEEQDEDLHAWLHRLEQSDNYAAESAHAELRRFKRLAAEYSVFEKMCYSGTTLIGLLCNLVEELAGTNELNDTPMWLLEVLYRPAARSIGTDGRKLQTLDLERRRLKCFKDWRDMSLERRTAREKEYAAADRASFGTQMLLRRYVMPPSAFEPDPAQVARHASHVAFYDTPFRGDALSKVMNKIREHEQAIVAGQLRPSARSFALYQSSGMGKSRLLHELCTTAKHSASMPIVGFTIRLALPTSSSLPAGDELQHLRSSNWSCSRIRTLHLMFFFRAFFETVAKQFGSLDTLQARDRFAELSELTGTADLLQSQDGVAQSRRRDFLRAVDERFYAMTRSLVAQELASWDGLRNVTRRVTLPPDGYFVLCLDELSALTSASGVSSEGSAALVDDVLNAWKSAGERFWLLFTDSSGHLLVTTPTRDHSAWDYSEAPRQLAPFVGLPLNTALKAYADGKPLIERTLAELSSFELACSFGRPLWATLPNSPASLDDCLRVAEAKLLDGELASHDNPTTRRAQLMVLLSQRLNFSWPAYREAAAEAQEYEIRHHMRVVYEVDQLPQEGVLSFASSFPREPILASAARRILALRRPELDGWAAACTALRSMGDLNISDFSALASQLITSIAYDRVLEPRRDELCAASDPEHKASWQEDSIITVRSFVSSLLGPEVASQLDDRQGACLMHFSRWYSLDDGWTSPPEGLLQMAFITGCAYKGAAAGKGDWDLVIPAWTGPRDGTDRLCDHPFTTIYVQVKSRKEGGALGELAFSHGLERKRSDSPLSEVQPEEQPEVQPLLLWMNLAAPPRAARMEIKPDEENLHCIESYGISTASYPCLSPGEAGDIAALLRPVPKEFDSTEKLAALCGCR